MHNSRPKHHPQARAASTIITDIQLSILLAVAAQRRRPGQAARGPAFKSWVMGTCRTSLRFIGHQLHLAGSQGKGRAHYFEATGFDLFGKDRAGVAEPGGDVLHVGPDRILQRVAWLAFGFRHSGPNRLHDARDVAGFFGVGNSGRNSAGPPEPSSGGRPRPKTDRSLIAAP